LRCSERLGEEHHLVGSVLFTLAKIQFDRKWNQQAESNFHKARTHTSVFLWLWLCGMLVQAVRLCLLRKLTIPFALCHGVCSHHSLQALQIQRRALGEQHPSVALTLEALGTLCHKTGRWADAETFFLQALSINTLRLGGACFLLYLLRRSDRFDHRALSTPHNPDPFLSLSLSLSVCVFLFSRLMWPGNHIKVAIGLSKLAALYRSSGRPNDAHELLLRSLEVRC
jgi:tetratricopeptide (TPR) repeat protein